MTFSFKSPALSAALLLIPVSGAGAAVFTTNWTAGMGSPPITGASTSSPVVGNGTAESADNVAVHASFNPYTLSQVGNSISLFGTVTMAGITIGNTASDQFRMGLYDVAGNSGTSGWRGYLASAASGTGAATGAMRERSTNEYWSGNGTGILGSTYPAPQFLANTSYQMALTIQRTAAGLEITPSFKDAAGLEYASGLTYLDTTPLTYTFNRVGFLLGGSLNADQVSFSNLFVTPEPGMSTLTGLAAACALLVRRRPARK